MALVGVTAMSAEAFRPGDEVRLRRDIPHSLITKGTVGVVSEHLPISYPRGVYVVLDGEEYGLWTDDLECRNCSLNPCECDDSAPMDSAEYYRYVNG